MAIHHGSKTDCAWTQAPEAEKANVAYARAELARAKRELDRTSIRAPFDSLIRNRAIDLGQFVSAGTLIGEVCDTSVGEIRLPISNQDIPFLPNYHQEEAMVQLSTSIAGETVQWQAKIARDEGVVDETNRMMYLVAEVYDPYLRQQGTNHTQALKFGTFVTAKIQGVNLPVWYNCRVIWCRRSLGQNEQVVRRKVVVIRTDNTMPTSAKLKQWWSSLNHIAWKSKNSTRVKVLGETSAQEAIKPIQSTTAFMPAKPLTAALHQSNRSPDEIHSKFTISPQQIYFIFEKPLHCVSRLPSP